MSETINERNIHALHEAIKEDRVKIDELKGKVESLSKQTAMYQTELNAMRGQLAVVMARMGGGSTAGG